MPFWRARIASVLHRGADGFSDRELGWIEVDLARLNLRKIKNVVDHGEEMIRRRFGHLEILALLGLQLGVEHQSRHAEDAVHRRPNLMAHVRQELALRSTRGLRHLFRLLQLGFGLTALSHLDGELLGPFLDSKGELAAARMQVPDADPMAGEEEAPEAQREAPNKTTIVDRNAAEAGRRTPRRSRSRRRRCCWRRRGTCSCPAGMLV